MEAGHERPLLIGLKEEGGLYDYLPFGLGAAQFPYPLSLAAGNSPSATFEIGQSIGQKVASIGVNWVFTPTLDLLSEITEPLTTSQTFGGDAGTVSDHAVALIRGLSSQGLSACSNAHPNGSVTEIFRSQSPGELASHVDEQSDQAHFIPIATVLNSFPHNSMQFGAAVHEFSNPEQSAQIIRTACDFILRQKCGFQGPTVSSLLETPEEASVCPRHAPLMTFQCALDMVKLPKDSAAGQASIAILESAVASKVLPASSIAASAARVTRLKTQYLDWGTALRARQPSLALSPAQKELAQRTYRAATTVNSSDPSPLIGLDPNSVLLLLTPTVPRRHPTSPSDPFEPLGRALSHSFSRLRHVPYTLSAGITENYRPFFQRATAVILVLCNTSSALVESQDEVVQSVQNILRVRDATPNQPRTRKVVIGAGDPRDLRDAFEGWWSVCCYEYSRGALEAAAEVVLGDRQATGKLPR
ncbi:MAG: hypothetical protein Q9220_004951 [cf. Caloplaca sp. 1 TL-2023]